MKTTHTQKFRNTLAILLIGIATTVSAQTNKNQNLQSVNQDSVAFHQWLIEQGNTRDSNTIHRSIAMPYSGSFKVLGNVNTFYPVAFADSAWASNEATILNLGRSSAHADGTWHGSMIATFRFHTTRWGNGSPFIDADIKQSHNAFVAGWKDATENNNSFRIVIWLRGQTTYYYHCNYPQKPIFTSGSLTIEGTTHGTKPEMDSYVNPHGPTFSGNAWVRGNVRASEVKVDVGMGADFVFEPDYPLLPLGEVEQFILNNRHLPDIAPASEMIENGVGIGEMQIKLLQKIEELTLYIIEQNKRMRVLEEEIRAFKNK